MRILGLDYGTVRTGVAISDVTETVARPVTVVRHAAGEDGLARLKALVRDLAADLVVVGLPVSLDAGEHGQARATRAFVERLKARLDVPVVVYDERFTTAVAHARGGKSELDARAAAVMLEDYLRARARS